MDKLDCLKNICHYIPPRNLQKKQIHCRQMLELEKGVCKDGMQRENINKELLDFEMYNSILLDELK